MGLKWKRCADCQKEKWIGKSKRRCKACRVADPHKIIPNPNPRQPNRKKMRLTIGPFNDWRIHYLPKCAYPKNKDYSTINLGKSQRKYVLEAYGFKDYKTYLQSDLWQSIRSKVLKENPFCSCGCGAKANQVHHKSYTEANLLGKSLRGLVAINHDCHYEIEFAEERKTSLGEANSRLKQKQKSDRFWLDEESKLDT